MISGLLEVLMSNDSQGDKAVFLVCEGTAWTWLYFAVDWLIAGKPIVTVFTFVGLGVFFAVLGVKWPTMRIRLGSRFSGFANAFENIASDYRYRTTGVIFLIFSAAIMVSFYLHSIRQDIDMYAKPRVVTDTQAIELKKVLSANKPVVPINVFASVGDPEAMEYAGELTNAIAAGGWEAHPVYVNPWDAEHPATDTGGVNKMYLALDRGLGIRTCVVGQPTNPDPKNPTPDAVLILAFRQAHIEMAGGGGNSGCSTYSLSVEVGRRPVIINYQSPLHDRLGRWLISLSQ